MAIKRTFIAVLLGVAIAGTALFGRSDNALADTTTVIVGDNWFCDASYFGGFCDTTITAGDTVVWDYPAGSTVHTVTDCGADCDSPTDSPAFDSGLFGVGESFSRNFDTPGTYLYYCEVHPFDMFGRVIVEAASEPAPSPEPDEGDDPTPAPDEGTSTPEVSDQTVVLEAAQPGEAAAPVAIPDTGGPPRAAVADIWALLLIAGGVLASAGVASLAVARTRPRR